MMKRICIVACCLLVFLAVRTKSVQDEQPRLLSVRIVPTSYGENSGRIIRCSRFYVVITNISDKPLRLWNTTCPWGYRGLSFRVTDESGKMSVVERKVQAWRKTPSPEVSNNIIPSGDHMIYEISFTGGQWENALSPNVVAAA